MSTAHSSHLAFLPTLVDQKYRAYSNNWVSKQMRCLSHLWITGKRKPYGPERCAYPTQTARQSETAERAMEQQHRESELNTLACLVVDRGLSWNAAEVFYVVVTLLRVCLQPCMELLEIYRIQWTPYTLYLHLSEPAQKIPPSLN